MEDAPKRGGLSTTIGLSVLENCQGHAPVQAKQLISLNQNLNQFVSESSKMVVGVSPRCSFYAVSLSRVFFFFLKNHLSSFLWIFPITWVPWLPAGGWPGPPGLGCEPARPSPRGRSTSVVQHGAWCCWADLLFLFAHSRLSLFSVVQRGWAEQGAFRVVQMAVFWANVV